MKREAPRGRKCLTFGMGREKQDARHDSKRFLLAADNAKDAAPLVARISGSVLLPGDVGYDEERAVWNLNHELVPAVIVAPASAADVQAAVTFADGQLRPVLVKTTGHQIVGQAHGAVVIATRRMNDVAIKFGRPHGAGRRRSNMVRGRQEGG